jgi:hypothetical protein
MNLSAGAKLKSAVCTAEGIVIRAPDAEGILRCGAAPMLVGAESASADAVRLDSAEAGAALVGKRYVDEATGLEILCTKGGKAALSFEGRSLSLKQAKPLPSSD